jgi:hypothetical protein
MGVRIGEISSRFELMNWDEPQVGRIRRAFLDHDEALRFVQSQLLSVEAFAIVRRWASDHALTHETDRGFMTLLAAKLMSGELWVTEQERDTSRLGGGHINPVPPTPGPGPKPGPKPKPETVAELLVTVTDLNGKPVADATVTAGALGSRVTDKDGKADFGTVTPGTYDISAAKPGHGKRRNGPEEKDEKKSVSVPNGTKTEVKLIQHPECANVAFFEGPPGREKRMHYYGFDHVTNIRATGGHSYWDPVPAKGAVKFEDRDETRWVSVAVGQETEVEINFAFLGPECIPCLANTTFKMDDASKAEVVTAHVTAKKAAFKIKGKAAGETTMKVICDGKDIGRLFIWCAQEKSINLDLCLVTTTRTRPASYSVAEITTNLNSIYRQAAMKISVLNLGTIDLSANAAVAAAEASIYPADGSAPFGDTDPDPLLAVLEQAANQAFAAKPTGPQPRNNTRKLIFYVPATGCDLNGMARNIGFSSVFVFYDRSPDYFSTCAHELGHSVSLCHPSDDNGVGQYAPHNFATRGQNPTPAWPATNTEPAIALKTYVTQGQLDQCANVMGNDPLNLMGYWHDRTVRNQLRYHQWKAMDRK